MIGFSHCGLCGRRLRNAYFCPECGQSLCGSRCFDEHVATHLGGPQALLQLEQNDPSIDPDPNRPDQAHPLSIAGSLVFPCLCLAGLSCLLASQQLA
jgi:hypothetical protein